MEDFLMAEDYELSTIVNRGPLTPTKQNGQNETIPKDPSEFVAANFKMMEKNAKAKKILICGIGTNQVKRSRIELPMRNYELFSMKESEHIQEMMTRFTIKTNELKSLGNVFTSEELVSKVLRILPASWESKVTTIQEAKKLDKIS
ncbi:uncharacterized protein [Nicotiana tomentosiformis]|uniref:uncharacterized protein n=1 Tax=Nicotiana tomentosiformis TaxID=4098 RepID=UPI00388C6297